MQAKECSLAERGIPCTVEAAPMQGRRRKREAARKRGGREKREEEDSQYRGAPRPSSSLSAPKPKFLAPGFF